MYNEPDIGEFVKIQAVQGEPSPYWVDLFEGRVTDIDGDTITVETAEGETRSKAVGGGCYSWASAEGSA